MVRCLGATSHSTRTWSRTCSVPVQVLASSSADGTKFGRPRKVDDTEHIATAKRMKADGHTGKDIVKYLGVSWATYIATWRTARLESALG